jgi:hypothetical protein
MIRKFAFTVALLLGATQAYAQPDDAPAASAQSRAVGLDVSYSIDADDTSVINAGANLDWRNLGPEEYQGIRLEKVWFNPSGQGWQSDERIYVRAADTAGKWRWNARVGTDGETVLGAASVRSERGLRPEFFVERDIVETPIGLREGIYYTFGGAAVDLPLGRRDTLALVGGLQEFTGDNVRTHLRGTYTHVVKEDAGLSVQLRGRYFHNSEPREFDYYSPRWYAQAVPVLQLRRFSAGWRYLVAGGVGLQRDSDTDWRRSSYFNAEVTGPPSRGWQLIAGILFSETPTTSDQSYSYFQARLGLTRRF